VAVKLGYKRVYRDPYGFPKWQEQGLPVASSPAGLSQSTSVQSEYPGAGSLKGWSLLWMLLGIFIGGMALNLTPCVYPMIPITVSFFGGRTAEDQPSQIKLILHGVCYILGLALTNSTLGVIAALTGGLMGSILQNPLVLTAVASVLVLFATSLFGLWELRMPRFLNQAAAKSHGGYFGSLFMGLTLGVVAAPCIGPFVLGLLTWIASIGSPTYGFIIFFVLSLGLGLPLFVLALFSGQLQRLPKAGGWMIWVRKVMGWVLVGMAAYFIRPVLPESVKVLLPIAVAVAAGLHLGWLDNNEAKSRTFPWLKAFVGMVCLVAATIWAMTWIMRGPGVQWHDYSEEIIQQAAAQGKPVIIDFYADWCAPCREFEELTFHDSEVVAKAKNKFLMIKVDVTTGGNPLHQKLLKRYDVKGVPTIIFLDPKGEERVDLRLVDYFPAKSFLGHMAEIRNTSIESNNL
jgi:thiol:disulfide interchange protein DsbD